MRRRRSYRMHGLGKLPVNCEIHVFADGSRKKACKKRDVSASARAAWTANLTNACNSDNLTENLIAACKEVGVKRSKQRSSSKKKA